MSENETWYITVGPSHQQDRWSVSICRGDNLPPRRWEGTVTIRDKHLFIETDTMRKMVGSLCVRDCKRVMAAIDEAMAEASGTGSEVDREVDIELESA
jgi:hypothetical protein